MVHELFTAHRGTNHLLVHVPHGSALFPPEDRTGLAISDEELFRNIALLRDAGVNRILSQLRRQQPELSFLRANRSRFYTDVERFDNPSEEMNAVGMGVLYTKTVDGKDLYLPGQHPDSRARKAKLYVPYHRALTQLTEALLSEHGLVHIIDLHSYSPTALPFELYADEPRPQICLGWNEDTQSRPLLEALEGSLGQHFEVGVNQAYKGSLVPNGFFGRSEMAVSSVMVEVRKDLVRDPANISRIAAAILQATAQGPR